MSVKVRIGFGLGTQTPTEAGRFGALVDDLERLGYDSLWLSERIGGPAPDPMIGLAVAAGRTKKLKLGTSVQVLPGRNPITLATAWASLDVLSDGRALPAFGLGVAHPNEQQAFGVERKERAAWFDEAIEVVRKCWRDETVDHDGERFHFEGLSVLPKPIQQLPEIWLGGRAPSELRRMGRLGEGWLASFTSPEQCREAKVLVDEAAEAAGRAIDREHYGAMVFYARDGIPDQLAELIKTRNPDVDADRIVVSGIDGVRDRCEEYVAEGFSKLVLVPMAEPAHWVDDLEALAADVLTLQN